MAVAAFNARARAGRCISDLDGELNTYVDDDGEDCVEASVFETIEAHLQKAFEAGLASREREYKIEESVILEKLRAQLAEKEADMQAVCDRADRLGKALFEKEAEAKRLREERDHYRAKAFGLPASKGDSDG